MKVLIIDNKNGSHSATVSSVVRMVNPNADIEVYGICDKGGTTTCDKLVGGLVYALANNYKLVNISLGLTECTEELRNIVNRCIAKGVILVCASGNNYSVYPALLDGVISVGAVDQEGNICSYTTNSYDILACGEYEGFRGTSFACAYVTGLLSLIGGE